MACPSDTSGTGAEPTEPSRRRAGAAGVPLRLADGRSWLLARPSFRAGRGSLTSPPIDRPLDRIFEHLALHDSVLLQDVWEVAIALLSANYDLGREEIADLVSVAPGAESREFVDAVLDVVFGSESAERTYTNWIRASLLANGLDAAEIPADDLPNVLAVLIATKRTVPAARFVDACRAADARSSLESLI